MSHTKEEFEHLKIPLEAIISATNNFSAENCIGKGGFGKVYKGEIVHSKGQSMVALKRLDRAVGQGSPEFWKEIMMLAVYRHENIVSLLGFCDEGDEKILVYEYASKGSLDLYLEHGDLSWIQRLKICIGAARGLAYLHNPIGTQLRVLHRDVKSSNILLDENWNAKISDFGLSKLGPVNHQFTIGYCDPLYVENGFLTKESDVYSFGVVLFEVLCRRLCVSNLHDKPLTKLVRESYEENKISEIVHGNLKDGIDHRSLKLFTRIAYQCLKRDREERPLMAEIVRILETALEYQANPHSIKDVDIPLTIVDGADKTKSRKLSEIVDSSQLRAIRLPDPMASSKVMRLVYTNSGADLLALTSSGIHKLWKWQRIDRNPYGKSTASIVPQLWQPTNGALMCNDVSESKPPAEESTACIALSKNDCYVMSASGGKVSLFNMRSFKVMTTFMPPPPAATYLAFHPHDNNVIAMGMEDSTIQIYKVRVYEVTATLKGHQKQITGLAFSWIPAVLVSSGADAQICIWNTDTWEKITSRCLESPPGYPSPIVGETKVQLPDNHRHVLVVHESQIAIYDDQLEFLRWWSPRESLSAPISSAVYSCDGLLVFTGFLDGAVGVFDADSLRLRCRIAPSAYISSSISSKSNVYPVDMAAHPLYIDQFAVGLSDGSVHVIEPAAGETTWGGVSEPHQDGSSALFNSSNSGLNSEPQSFKDVDVSVLTIADGADKTKSWKLSEIVDSSQLRALRLPDRMDASKVMRLVYTNSGAHLLALTSSAIHKLWKWQRSGRNPSGKSTASIIPQLWQPTNGALMCNDVSESKPAEESAACIALSKNDRYVMSASGGKVSLFNMRTFKVMTTFMPPPPAATYLAFHPQDNNTVAIGMEDSTIQIYNVMVDEVKIKLKGHQKQITGLAFSQTLNALVSSGADGQLCIWNINGWEKRKSRSIQSPPGHPSSLVGETKVQFHNDQRHVLVVHETQIAIYDYQLECLRLWSPRESLSAPISSAIYSCDGLLLFTGFSDGAVGVFDADSLRLRCRIAPSAYISSSISSSNSTAYPVVIAAHPSDPNQFALGMSDGSVHVIEPADADPKWGGSAPQENGTLASSNPSNSAMNSQPSETPSR